MFIASAHHFFSTCMWFSIDLARSVSVQFIRSAIPFCCGKYGTVAWCTIPAFRHTSANRLFMYSPPLSVRIHLVLVFTWFFIIDLYSVNLLTTPNLCVCRSMRPHSVRNHPQNVTTNLASPCDLSPSDPLHPCEQLEATKWSSLHRNLILETA